jgi:uncharacterized membrane protein
MSYLVLKWVHIVSSTILFGTGIGIAFFKWASDRREDVYVQAAILRIVVRADWLFTAPAVVIQFVSGLWLVNLTGLSLHTRWIAWAIGLYLIAGGCWLPVVWLQLKMRSLAEKAVKNSATLPAEYHRYRRAWFALGVPAFLSLLAVFYLMVFKPQ